MQFVTPRERVGFDLRVVSQGSAISWQLGLVGLALLGLGYIRRKRERP